MSERPHKGECIHDFRRLPDSYIIIDTETTGLFSDSEIIQLAALKIEHGVIVDQFDSLVHSVNHIPKLISELTGITDEMLLLAPSPRDALSAFLEFVGYQYVVAHNAHFDVNILYDSCERYLGRPFSNCFFDSLHLARRVISDIDDHKLSTLCIYFNIQQENVHNALADCISLHQCLIPMLNRHELAVPNDRKKSERRIYDLASRLRDDALTELRKIVNDYRANVFPENWLYFLLSTWLDDYIEVPDSPYFCDVYNKITSFVEDKTISEDESKELLVMIDCLCRPDGKVYNCCACDIDTYNGKNVCFTGDFESLTRDQAENIVVQLGATVKTSVSRKISYLIVGSQGSSAWSDGNMGSKLKLALNLLSQGHDIKIISEDVFLKTIGDYI